MKHDRELDFFFAPSILKHGFLRNVVSPGVDAAPIGARHRSWTKRNSQPFGILASSRSIARHAYGGKTSMSCSPRITTLVAGSERIVLLLREYRGLDASHLVIPEVVTSVCLPRH